MEKKFDEKEKKEISDRIGLFTDNPRSQIQTKEASQSTKLFEQKCRT